MEYIVKVCVVLRNMTVEAQRDEYESGFAELQTCRDIEVTSTRAGEVIFARSDTMPISLNGET